MDGQSDIEVIGQSQVFLQALDHASQLATLNRPVLILGERGSGKELLAERLHYLSSRWDEPFVKLNCAAFTETLVESTLFGHDAGAFTGAVKKHSGYFERVQSGTLFLDEIATLSPRIQEKLLRVLEYGEFERVGGSQTLHSRARIVGATHGDLQSMVQAGQFRADLLDRLAFDVVHVPPLRERGDDVLLLAEHFALGFVAQLNWQYFPGFHTHAADQLMAHHWLGNVRELKNTVERSLFRWSLPEEPVAQIHLDPFRPPWATEQPALDVVSGACSDQPIHSPVDYPVNFKDLRHAWEKQLVLAAMAACDHHQGRAASALSLSYDQFRAIWRRVNERSSR